MAIPAQLPAELIFHILELVGRHDKPTLRSFALTSTEYLPSCRRLLFYEVDVYGGRNSSQAWARYLRLLETFTRNPNLAVLTRVLSINLSVFEGTLNRGRTGNQFLGLLTQLKDLRSLKMVFSPNRNITTSFTPAIREAIRTLLQQPGIKHIQLHGFHGFPLSWLPQSQIESLQLKEWTFQSTGKDAVLRFPPWLALEAESLNSGYAQMDFSGIKHLAICEDGLFSNVTRSTLKLVPILSRMVSLTDLRIVFSISEITSKGSGQRFPALHFPRTLRSLELELRPALPQTPSIAFLVELIAQFPEHLCPARHLILRIPANWMVIFNRMSENEHEFAELENLLMFRFQTVDWIVVFQTYHPPTSLSTAIQRIACEQTELASKQKRDLHIDLRVAFSKLHQQGRLALSYDDLTIGPMPADPWESFWIVNSEFER